MRVVGGWMPVVVVVCLARSSTGQAAVLIPQADGMHPLAQDRCSTVAPISPRSIGWGRLRPDLSLGLPPEASADYRFALRPSSPLSLHVAMPGPDGRRVRHPFVGALERRYPALRQPPAPDDAPLEQLVRLNALDLAPTDGPDEGWSTAGPDVLLPIDVGDGRPASLPATSGWTGRARSGFLGLLEAAREGVPDAAWLVWSHVPISESLVKTRPRIDADAAAGLWGAGTVGWEPILWLLLAEVATLMMYRPIRRLLLPPAGGGFPRNSGPALPRTGARNRPEAVSAQSAASSGRGVAGRLARALPKSGPARPTRSVRKKASAGARRRPVISRRRRSLRCAVLRGRRQQPIRRSRIFLGRRGPPRLRKGPRRRWR